MDIIDFLKDVNHWGVLAVCVYGIIVFMSSLFKNSVNEKVRISMTVVAVVFLAGIIIWVLFFGSGDKKEITASNSEAHDAGQLAVMKRRLDAALSSLDVKEEETGSLKDRNSVLGKQVASANESRDYLAGLLKQERQNAARLARQLETAVASLDKLNAAKKSSAPSTRHSSDKPGWLGVEIIDGINGVTVDAVFHGSPAEKAGIKPGDVISEFNGVHIKSVNDFESQFKNLSSNSTVRVVILRDKTNMIFLDVKLAAHEE
ncbi:MAG: PDZ domain-containing protein [Synergistaceae bacterium]|nr:PDZ domain-containing protein [Synergistaceae bacterium]